MKGFLIVLLTTFSLISCTKKVKEIPHDQYKVEVIHDNWDSTLSAANTQDKNIVLMIHASWCSICNTFINTVLTDESVETEIGNKIIVSLIDGDKEYGKPYYTQFGASGFPTFVITDKAGNQIAKRSGQLSKEEFLSWISPHYK
jgi:thioredoxin-related protein